MRAEAGLFVIWPNARPVAARIVDAIAGRFDVATVRRLRWSDDLVGQHFSRLYRGPAVAPYSTIYESQKGRGETWCVIVVDPEPRYEQRQTPRGPAVVNTNLFDAKQEFRTWAGGHMRVHASDTLAEARRDTLLLLGEELDDLVADPHRTGTEIPDEVVLLDAHGAHTWTTFAAAERLLATTVRYVWLTPPGRSGTTPELLTADYDETVRLLNARPVDRLLPSAGGRFTVSVSGAAEPMTIRVVGDGYFDREWQEAALARARLDDDGRRVLDPGDREALATYRNVVHRTGPSTAASAVDGIDALEGFLAAGGYRITEPADVDVLFRGSLDPSAREGLARRCRRAIARGRRPVGSVAIAYRAAKAAAATRWPAGRRLWRRVRSGWKGWLGGTGRWRMPIRRIRSARLRELAGLGRGILFLGRRYRCPLCRWSFRAFAAGSRALARNHDGYCPRCNAKARHRRIWRFLEEHGLPAPSSTALHIGPRWALVRRLRAVPQLMYVTLDIVPPQEYITVRGDVTRLPFADGRFDFVLAVHLLEHLDDDRAAIAELYRVLDAGGVAVVSVPIRLDQPTYEDPTITSPAERAQAFGEADHRRWYGLDLKDRLEEVGFRVDVDLATALDPAERRRYGLRDDEHLFIARRPSDRFPVFAPPNA